MASDLANSAPCHDCYYCRRGLENLCENLLFNNGAYAEYIRIPARIVEKNTYAIPSHVGYQDAASRIVAMSFCEPRS